MRQDQQVTSPEYFAFLSLIPFVVLDELKDVVHVQPLFELDLVFSLNFSYDAD